MRRQIAPFQTWAESRLLPLICLLGLMLSTQPSQAAAEGLPLGHCNAGRHTGVVEPLHGEPATAVLRKAAASAIEDVVIGPDGQVRGRVAAEWSSGDPTARKGDTIAAGRQLPHRRAPGLW